ncbi:hypothetical protein C3L33_16260, partial [Rhododendron williamsianum]
MMNVVGDAGRRLKDACLSGSVAVLEALIGEDELILNRVSSLTGFFTNGTTPLHVAASLGHLDLTKDLLARKRKLATEFDSTRYHKILLEIKIVKDDANVKNRNKLTALDFVEHCPNRDLKTMEILELFFQAGVRRPACGGSNPKPESLPDNPPSPPSDWRRKAGEVLQSIFLFWIKYFKVNHTWLREVRGHLITAATLTATMAYQAILSPPGGFTQGSSEGNETMSLEGTAVLDSPSTTSPRADLIIYYTNPLADYMLLNTIVLIGSLCTIMLALSGFPATNKFLMWLLIFTVYITIFFMSSGYVLAMSLVFPIGFEKYALPLEILWHIWRGLCGFVLVLHTSHFLVWLWNKFVNIKWLRNKFGDHLLGLWNKFGDLVKTCSRSIWHYISG